MDFTRFLPSNEALQIAAVIVFIVCIFKYVVPRMIAGAIITTICRSFRGTLNKTANLFEKLMRGLLK